MNEELNEWFKENNITFNVGYSADTRLYYASLLINGCETDIAGSGETVNDAVDELLGQLAYEI